MTTPYYTFAAPLVAQVNTITPASVTSGDIFNVVIGSKTVTFTATASTVANVVTGLTAALAASAYAEFKEITWAANGSTDIIGTAKIAGVPFVQTSNASGTIPPTLVTATPTANSSPSDASNVLNWSTGALPGASANVVIENNSIDILYGLSSISGTTLATFTVHATYTGKIGLPEYNPLGYTEYRPQYYQLHCPVIVIGDGPGRLSKRIKIDSGSNVTAITVYGTGSAADSPLETFLWKGTNASNTLNVNSGSVGVAVLAGEVATLATWNAGYETNQASDSKVRFGSGVTLTSGIQTGGIVTVQSNAGIIVTSAGTLNVQDAATVTTLDNQGANCIYTSSGTLGQYYGANGSILDFSQNTQPRTVTDITLYKGARLLDPQRTVTWSNPIVLSRCRLSDVVLNLGSNITLQPAYS